jgi:DNA-binding transcriptional MerR regulator/methylmalonyl-CoA mutase cobalamin-binding subunit
MTNHDAGGDLGLMSISAAERDCGLPKETLRAWERRYGFPNPLRDRHGDRLYPPDQVARLRLLRRLVDAGYRPGKIVARPADDLSALLQQFVTPPGEAVGSQAQQVLNLLSASDAVGLREVLNAFLMRSGLGAFASDTAAELAEAIGAAWARGDLEIHQEHLFTEQFTTVLRSAINAAQGAGLPRRRPRVLFSTFPQEPHALGLLMAEAMFTLEGCLGISLGVQTPVPEIAAAARAHEADIVALSFSAMMPAAQAKSGLAELRALLPELVEIWAGGACAGLQPRPGVAVIRGLSGVGPAVTAWRERRSPENVVI